MKRSYLLAMVLSASAASVLAQGLSTPSAVIPVVSAPSGACPSPAIWEAPVSSPGTLWYCSGSPGTWTLYTGGGGGGGTYPSGTGIVQVTGGSAWGTTVTSSTAAFVASAIPQATAPTVVPHCTTTPCTTDYDYSINFWYGSTTQGFYSESSNDTSVNNSATLNGTNYNTISTTCPAGATFWTANRDGGGTAQGTFNDAIACGSPLVDNGLAITALSELGAGGFYIPGPGMYLNELVVGSNGDTQSPDVFIGTPDYAAGSAVASWQAAQFAVQYAGSTVNRRIGASIAFDSTDTTTPPVAELVAVGTENGTIASATAVQAFITQDDGVNSLPNAQAFVGQVTGKVTGVEIFSSVPLAGTYGTIEHFGANGLASGATTQYGFYSNIATGSGQWQAYMGGTAPSYFGGPVDLGVSGTLVPLVLANATSGTVTLEPVTGALGTVTASLPANTGTIAETNYAQTWSASQTFAAATFTTAVGNTSVGSGVSGTNGQLFVEQTSGAVVGTLQPLVGTVSQGAIYLSGNAASGTPSSTNFAITESAAGSLELNSSSGGSAGLYFGDIIGYAFASGSVTKWAGLTTAGYGVTLHPFANVALTGQTAAIATTSIGTTVATGLHKVCYQAKITTAASTSSALGAGTTSGFIISYTDGTDSTSQTTTVASTDQTGAVIAAATGNVANTTAASAYGCGVVYAKTGTALSYAYGYTSVGGTPMAYEIHATVELSN